MQRQHPYPKLEALTHHKWRSFHVNDEMKSLIAAVNFVNNAINVDDEVFSCNLPTQGKEHRDMVFLVQGLVDRVMESGEPLLTRILKAADLIQEYKAGNCQHKVFLATKLLLEYFLEHQMADMDKTPSIEICYCDSESDQDGHFFIKIADQIIFDPWAQLCFPVEFLSQILKSDDGDKIYSGSIKNFFSVQRDWACLEAEREGSYLQMDTPSTRATFSLFQTPDTSLISEAEIEEDKKLKRPREETETSSTESPHKKPKLDQ